MILVVIPLTWAALWAVLAVVICAALGIAADDPRLWLYMAGIFVGGGILLPAITIGVWVKTKKRTSS